MGASSAATTGRAIPTSRIADRHHTLASNAMCRPEHGGFPDFFSVSVACFQVKQEFFEEKRKPSGKVCRGRWRSHVDRLSLVRPHGRRAILGQRVSPKVAVARIDLEQGFEVQTGPDERRSLARPI